MDAPGRRPPPVQNDLAPLCGMVALLAGSGALGGAVGTAQAKHLEGGPFLLAVACGLIVGLAVTSAVWYVGWRGSLSILRRKAPNTLPWRRVLPVMFVVLLVSFTAAGYLGALLTELAMSFILD